MTGQKYLQDLLAEIGDWDNKVLFYKDDMKILQKRLEEVSAKNSAHDFHAQVERFQNRIIIFIHK